MYMYMYINICICMYVCIKHILCEFVWHHIGLCITFTHTPFT